MKFNSDKIDGSFLGFCSSTKRKCKLQKSDNSLANPRPGLSSSFGSCLHARLCSAAASSGNSIRRRGGEGGMSPRIINRGSSLTPYDEQEKEMHRRSGGKISCSSFVSPQKLKTTKSVMLPVQRDVSDLCVWTPFGNNKNGMEYHKNS